MTHSDLARQLKVLGLDASTLPADLTVWREFLDDVTGHFAQDPFSKIAFPCSSIFGVIEEASSGALS